MALCIGQGKVPAERFADGAEQKSRFEALLPELRRTIRGVDAGEGQNWADLIGLVADAPAPRGVAEFRHHLAALPPLELKLAMLGYHDRGFRAAVGDELFRAAAAGTERAVKRFKLRAAALGRPGEGQAGPLVNLPADLVAERTLAILDALPEALYLVRPGASEVLARAAVDATGVAELASPEAAVQRLTRGIIPSFGPDVSEVVLVPTLVFAPWTLIIEHESTRIFCFPVPPHEARKGQPEPEVVAVFRALGDGTRLRILRRLASGGPATFGQLSRELGLAKSTLHQHALLLRTAGLIRLRLDSNAGLELNPDPPDVGRLLADLMQPGGIPSP